MALKKRRVGSNALRLRASVDLQMIRDLSSEEVRMQVMVVHHTPTLTRERYERVVRGLSGKDRLESPSDVPTTGLLVHVAAETDEGFMIFDVSNRRRRSTSFEPSPVRSRQRLP